MPKVEEQLTGVVKEGFDPRSGKLPDFYGKDALAELTKKGLPSEVPFEQAKLLAQEKTGHISDEYIQKAGKDFSKLKIDSLGKSSLYKSRIQLKIGFEIGYFKKIKKKVKEQIPMDELKQTGEDKVEYFMKGVAH